MSYEAGFEDGFFAALILMASLHGVLLAAILFFSKRLNSKSNKFLALSLIGICIILGYEFSYYIEDEFTFPLILQYFPFYIRTTIPVGIFYFVTFLIQPNHQLSPLERLGFLVIAIEVIIESMYIPVNLMYSDEATIAMAEKYIESIGEILGIITSLILLPWSLRKVYLYQKFLYNNYSTTTDKSLSWLFYFLLLISLVLFTWMVSFTFCLRGNMTDCEETFGLVTLGLIILLFWIGYAVILKYNWFQVVPYKEDQFKKEQQGNKLSSKTNLYHDNLISLMQKEKLYENIDLTLDSLSERLQISSGYLSQIINEKEQKNFFEFVNFYRVEAVKEKLLDKEYNNYTIMGIALESGFKSKSTFNAVFKKFTGQTPSSFKRINKYE